MQDSELGTRIILAKTFRPEPNKFKPKYMKRQKSSFRMSGAKVQIDVPVRNRGRIEIRNKRKNALNEEKDMNFAIGFPEGKMKKRGKKKRKKRIDGRMAIDNTVIYQDNGDNSDYAIQTLDGGIRILSILNNEQAPTEFVYPLFLNETDTLQEDFSTGEIMIRDADGDLKAFF